MIKPIRFQSIHRSVADYIRDQIEEGRYRPGEKINEKELCEILGISRTPIREALIQLGKEGLVDIQPRRGVRVRKLTPEEVKHMYKVVGLLESEAAVEAADKLTVKDFQRMESLLEKSILVFEKGDIRGYLNINFDLHEVHLSLCHNPILLDILHSLKKQLHDFPRQLEQVPAWITQSIEDHRRLINAFRERDKERIRSILKDEHWGAARDYHFGKSRHLQ